MGRLADILIASSNHFPNRIAVQTPGTAQGYTYAELNERVHTLANILLKADLQAGDRVGVLLKKTPDAVVALLAVLQAGGVCVPIDALAPIARSRYILTNAGASMVITEATLSDSLVEAKLLPCPLDDFRFKLYRYTEGKGKIAAIPDDLAYILYTSGSTGQPKGVMITNKNALAFVQWAVDHFKVCETDTLSSIAPFHFDLSIFDLYASLSAGASLLLIDQQIAKNPRLLADYLAAHRVSVIYATPTLLRLLLRFGKLDSYDYTSLRAVLYAGEVFPVAALKKLLECWPTVSIHNLYGPTETNVVTILDLPQSGIPADWQEIPIGLPCPYASCKLYNAESGQFSALQPGQQGELLIGGDSVSPGYLGRANLNKKVFIYQNGQRWYRSGDLVKVDEQGLVVFIGRVDRMVKRRGYRIEPAEIERALSLHPAVAQAVIVSHADKQGETKITAFLALRADITSRPGFIEWKTYCQSNLPLYMIPDHFQIVAEIPLTSSQKVDLQHLKSLANA